MQRRGSKQTAKRPRTSRRRTRKATIAPGSTHHSAKQFEGLKRERDDAREQQAATAEILRIIRSSPSHVQPVFETIVRSAVSLCEGLFANVFRFDGELLHFVASHNLGPSIVEMMGRKYPMRPDPSQVSGRVVLAKSVVWLEDALADPNYDRQFAIAMGWRRLLGVPMLRDGEPIGVIGVGWAKPGRASKVQEDLLKTFADQAVIAIENTRLLSELRESLQQQTATADVLKVISRSTFDLQVVLDTLVESAARLCRADRSAIRLVKDSLYYEAAMYGHSQQHKERMLREPLKPGRGSVVGRVVLDGHSVHVHDAQADPDTELAHRSRSGNVHTILGVPLLREGTPIGVLLLQRSFVQPFSDKEIELAETFADQAVIAIENVRLFDEVQARTRELSESLEQQTATSEVLKVISGSPEELQTVFETILANATRICEAGFGLLHLSEGESFRTVALHNVPETLADYVRKRGSFRPAAGSPVDRLLQNKQVIYTADEAAQPSPGVAARLGGARSLIAVPMLKGGTLIGAIVIYRQEVRPFTQKQIELLTNFAAQAVIAIENARLLNELRQRTNDLSESLEQQTATSEVLKVISSSPGELGPVFKTMLEKAVRVCGARFGILFLSEGDGFHTTAMHNVPRAFAEKRERTPFLRPTAGSPLGRVMLTRQVAHISDVMTEQGYTEGHRPLMDLVELGGARTAVCVPMLNDNELVGAITIYQKEVRPFSNKQIELLTSFAAQAVIAIENTRLLGELRQRTHDLTQSLEDLRTTQDRLVQTQKLALLGQLTAGIAHEIKNPLNFVNNFSGISAELIDELQDTLKGIPLNDKIRADINELTGTLKGNFDKVVHHGRRADAIVKNMLQHSREGSGEHRMTDINALVEESLNLAWHGARAETQGFEIKLDQSFDGSAGGVDIFPQDIRRALLNMISNGFYAANRRKADTNGGDYEPKLTASTKNLGDRVEIRIRDNGTGMTPDVKEKMFNPFFTTKPTGEGTGLGLSISHDIIVKQHGGSIEVDTQPGEFTEIRVILPRVSAPL